MQDVKLEYKEDYGRNDDEQLGQLRTQEKSRGSESYNVVGLEVMRSLILVLLCLCLLYFLTFNLTSLIQTSSMTYNTEGIKIPQMQKPSRYVLLNFTVQDE